jgi:RNA polymerase sigma-70 factor (ECF subfamily)
MSIAKRPEASFTLPAEVTQDQPPAPKDESIVVDLFRTHSKRVQNFLRFRLRDVADAEDAAQDVFLKLLRRERQGALRVEAKNYMYAATQSEVIDVERHRGRVERDHNRDVDVESIAQPRSDPEELLHWRNAMACFVDSIKALPETSKKVFVLYHFKGMGYDEIAIELGCSRRTVERHIAAGLVACRERMKDYL